MRAGYLWLSGLILTAAIFFAVILYGTVDIPANEVLNTLFGGTSTGKYVETIVLQTRLPMAVAATCCGATLSVAGLMLQTLFHNPLGGPSVLGISSGASFGVAILTLSAAGTSGLAGETAVAISGALIGGLLSILIIYAFSSIVKSGVTLLIVGIMIGYLCSSGISLLNYFSPAEEIRNYLVWGLGSFGGLRLTNSVWFCVLSLISLLPTALFIKPLNAMLLGERYLGSVGYSVKQVRGGILLFSGLLVAIPTAFCGPIGFIGLIVPHLCRLLFRSSNHLILLPGCILFGAFLSLLCAFISVVPASDFGVLPINVITPVIGVPVILYLLVKRNHIPYFS